MTEPWRGDPSSALPPLPDGAAAALLASVQRIVNPTLEGTGAGGYGYRVVQAAREAATRKAANAAAAAARSSKGAKRASASLTPPKDATPPRGKEEGAPAPAPHPNQLLHGAFVGFFREVLLDRYREYTLSYLEEQMVAFHADSFLASQPEGSHGFWADFFQTRLFAHFLLLEHRRVADTFQAPPPLALPRPDAAKGEAAT